MRHLIRITALALTLSLGIIPEFGLIAPATHGVLSGAVWAAEADAFVPGLEDVPLFAGLTVDSSSIVNFDTTSGRIVEAIATGPESAATSNAAISTATVTQFYQSALPQLGWSRTGVLDFEREGEHLSLSLQEMGGVLFVHFNLKPKR
jgi:hypothetical protein